MRVKGLLYWLSGVWTGVFVGALAACPERHVSAPLSVIIAVILAALARKRG